MSGDTTQTATTVKGAPTKYVKLNVGGSLHYVTLGTLTKQDNMLRAMFSGRMEVLTDTEGIRLFKMILRPKFTVLAKFCLCQIVYLICHR